MHTSAISSYGVLRVEGPDACAFLHAQLTVDVEQLAKDRARRAGWCSAKGRLLATFLLVPEEGGYLLQLSRDLVAPVGKRLSMFVLRAKVKVSDVSGTLPLHGLWGIGADKRLSAMGMPVPAADLAVTRGDGLIAVRLAQDRFLLVGAADMKADADEREWMLQDIRSGMATVTLATQDQLVPQMANFELIGGVDFRKGCYPGQEVVARAQYRGAVKRRLYRLRSTATLVPGQNLFVDDLPGQASGTVVNAAAGEVLAVLPIASVDAKSPVRANAGDEALEVLPLPYSR
ncbi:MAG: CAF17-like 4Fe-4S cluster assembly/insertion protein YgfZ [Betaproteobacteria bacterium]